MLITLCEMGPWPCVSVCNPISPTPSSFYSLDKIRGPFHSSLVINDIHWQIKGNSWFWLAMKHCCHGIILVSECQVVIDDKFYDMGPRIPFVTHARGALAINFEPMEMRSACIMTTQSRTRVAWKRLCINIPCIASMSFFIDTKHCVSLLCKLTNCQFVNFVYCESNKMARRKVSNRRRKSAKSLTPAKRSSLLCCIMGGKFYHVYRAPIELHIFQFFHVCASMSTFKNTCFTV